MTPAASSRRLHPAERDGRGQSDDGAISMFVRRRIYQALAAMYDSLDSQPYPRSLHPFIPAILSRPIHPHHAFGLRNTRYILALTRYILALTPSTYSVGTDHTVRASRGPQSALSLVSHIPTSTTGGHLAPHPHLRPLAQVSRSILATIAR